MRIVPIDLFAQRTRRRERMRTAPFYGLAGAITAGCLAPLWWGYWYLPLYVIASLGLPGAYLGGYLGELWKGRTVGAPAGRIAFEGDLIAIEIGDVATRISLARIVGARYFTCDGFEDLKGLCDVLELQLVTGTRVRVPDALDGFAAFFEELRERRDVTYV